MRLTYRTPTYDDEDEVHEADAGVTESGGNAEGEARNKTQWDDDCPWSEWYTTDDPVKGNRCCRCHWYLFCCALLCLLCLDVCSCGDN